MKKEVLFLIVLFLTGFLSAQNYAPGELIVKYKNDDQLYNLKFEENSDMSDIAYKYNKMKEVEYAEPNFIMKNSFVPNDANYSLIYWHKNIEAENAWNLTAGNKKIKITIIDTGVDWDHPDIYDNIWNSTDSCNDSLDLNNNGYKGDCRGYDFTDINITNYINAGYNLVEGEDYIIPDNNPMDFDGHGTHVAGIAAGVGNNNLGILGSCWNCSIMPLRAGFNIIDPSGNNVGSLEVDDVVSAIYYAADNNASIISMSFGGGDSKSVRDAVKYAYSKGVILVSSAGNSGSNTKQYPCGYDEVICVTSLNSDNSPAGYSNYGEWVDLSAPGTGILSTYFNDRYLYLSGTSMSAPLVSGAIGLIKSLFDKNQTEILSALKNTGTSINFSGTIIKNINVYSAILYLDDITPAVNLISPSNNSTNSTLNQIFICNSTDWQLKNITLKVWNDTNLFYNETKEISGIYNSSIFEVALQNNSYKWNCIASDMNNNRAYASENFSFSTIIEKQEIKNIFPENNTYTNSSSTSFGCYAQVNSKKSIKNLTFNLWKESKIIYNETKILTGNYNSSNFSYNFDSQGVYYWSCHVYTDSEEKIKGENFTINYDNTSPSIILLKPENNQNYESNNQEVEFSFQTNEHSDCSLIINNQKESELSNVLNGSFKKSFVSGNYSWKISCEDRSKNLRESETRNFSVKEKVESESSGDTGTSTSSSSGGGGVGSISSSPLAKTSAKNLVHNEEKNIQEKENKKENTEITGLAIDETDTNLSALQKYKNRANILTAVILLIISFLFYLNFRYEKKIAEEIKLIEK